MLYRKLVHELYIGRNGTGLGIDASSPQKLIRKLTNISLVFDKKPTSYEVKIWYTKNSELSQLIDVIDNEITISENQSSTIYEVIAKFDFSKNNTREYGTVYYAFLVN